MKAIQLNKVFFLLLIIVGFTTSCVQDDDYDLPDTTIVDPELPEGANIVSISSVVGVANQQSGGGQFTFSETNDFMEGYIISTDEGGNFFREIILQDKPENPTVGIKIALFVNPLFTRYDVGRKIYVSLDGFTVGTSNGVITLGIPDGDFIDEAPAQFESKIFRTSEIAEIVALPLSINQFSDQYENLFVKIENVQFLKEDVDNNLTFASESFDSFDGERTIESCESGASTIFSTSTFADFNNLKLPKLSGSIEGVLSRTFNGSSFVIAVNSVADIDMETERCDEEPVDGGGDPVGSLSQNFEGQTAGTGQAVNIENWVNVNVNGGERLFEVREFSNNKYAQTSAFNSDENPYNVWLVTPGVNLADVTSATLSFDTNDGFNNGQALTAYISTDFTGDPTQATWVELDEATYSTGNTNGYGSSFTPSGDIDLSAYAGEVVYIGFEYVGSSNGITTTYQIDNVNLVTE